MLLFTLVVILTFLVGCASNSNDICNNQQLTSVESPDKSIVAYIFTRDCGSTTKKSYQLSILNKGEKIGNTSGNIFISYGEFAVEWIKSDEIVVKTVTNGDIFKNEQKYKGIKINYAK